MALAFADRVRETTTTTGTGTITLAGAVTGYQSFSAIGNGNTTYYTINAGSQWEVGIGTYTASGTTLSRDTVLSSSNAGSLVDFSAGTKDVFATYPAGKAVYQDASGNVGIGTAAPGYKLDVAGTGYFGDNVLLSRTNTAGSLSGLTVTNAGTTTAYAGISINSGTVSSQLFNDAAGNAVVAGTILRTTTAHPLVLGTNATERMRIDSAGYVGIGTSSPGDLLHVNGNIRIGAATGANYIYSASTTFLAIQTGINAPLLFLSNNGSTETMRITSAGDVGIGTASPSSKLTVLNGDIEVSATGLGNTLLSFNGTTANLTVNSSSAPLVFGTSSTERMRIASNGNIGIGTSSPGTKLEVSGNVKLSAAGNYLTFGNPGLPLYLGDGTSLLFGPNNNEQYAVLRGYSGVALSTDGNPALFVNSSGNVGIGTSSPTEKLVLNSAGNVQVATKYINGNTAGVTIGAGADGSAFVYQAAAQPFIVYTNATERMRLDASGNLGIGTSSISYRLHVNSGAATTVGFFQSTGTSSFIGLSNASYTTYLGSFNDGSFRIQTPGSGFSDKVTVDISGNLLVGTTSATSGYLMSVNGALTLANGYSLSWGAYNSGGPTIAGSTNFLAFYPNGASSGEKMRITSAGQLLLGTTSLATKLGVVGYDTTYNNTATFSSGLASQYLDILCGFALTNGTPGGVASNTTMTLRSSGSSAGELAFATGNTEQMRITSGGNVGIGTSSAGAKLETYQTAGGTNAIRMNTNFASGNYVDLNPSIAGVSNGGFSISLNGTIRQVIDVSGNVGIGTTSPDIFARGYSGRIVGISSAGQSAIELNSATGSGAYFDFGVNGTRTGSIYSDVNGTDLSALGARNLSIGTSGAAVLVMNTNNVERVRISAAGGFSVGTTADPGAGAIYATGNITAYYSDEQLKTRLGNIDNALDILSEIDAFYYEANETAQALGYEAVREVGVSAQSVQRVLPEVVAPAPIDNKYLTVRYERLVPVLIEAIKELTARVAELEGK